MDGCWCFIPVDYMIIIVIKIFVMQMECIMLEDKE